MEAKLLYRIKTLIGHLHFHQLVESCRHLPSQGVASDSGKHARLQSQLCFVRRPVGTAKDYYAVVSPDHEALAATLHLKFAHPTVEVRCDWHCGERVGGCMHVPDIYALSIFHQRVSTRSMFCAKPKGALALKSAPVTHNARYSRGLILIAAGNAHALLRNSHLSRNRGKSTEPSHWSGSRQIAGLLAGRRSSWE